MALQNLGALTAEDVTTIQASAHQFSEGMVGRDVDNLVRFYTHDAVVMPPNQPAVEGRAAILEWLQHFPRASAFAVSISDIGGYGDVAYVRGHAEMTLHPDETATPIEVVMKYVEVRRKQVDGSWLIAVDVFNSDEPATELPAGVGNEAHPRMKALAEIQVIPIGVGVSVRKEVQAAHDLIKASGLKTQLHAYGTNVEGDLGEILEAIKQVHERLHAMGTERLSTSVKIGTRIDKDVSLDAKLFGTAQDFTSGA